jgi:hypothetical protein
LAVAVVAVAVAAVVVVVVVAVVVLVDVDVVADDAPTLGVAAAVLATTAALPAAVAVAETCSGALDILRTGASDAITVDVDDDNGVDGTVSTLLLAVSALAGVDGVTVEVVDDEVVVDVTADVLALGVAVTLAVAAVAALAAIAARPAAAMLAAAEVLAASALACAFVALSPTSNAVDHHSSMLDLGTTSRFRSRDPCTL